MKQYLEILESFVAIVLAIAGLIGASYHMFRDGGWIESILGKFLRYNFDHPTVAVPITIVITVAVMMLHNKRVTKGKMNKLPTFILYALMAAGTYFIGHYAIVGTL